MKALMVLVGLGVLLSLCWPLALLAVILWPLFWLVSLPFRLLSVVIGAAIALLEAVLYLPARLLGFRGRSMGRGH